VPKRKQSVEIEKFTETFYLPTIKQLQQTTQTFLGQHRGKFIRLWLPQFSVVSWAKRHVRVRKVCSGPPCGGPENGRAENAATHNGGEDEEGQIAWLARLANSGLR